jgi:hypothetical protein
VFAVLNCRGDHLLYVYSVKNRGHVSLFWPILTGLWQKWTQLGKSMLWLFYMHELLPF